MAGVRVGAVQDSGVLYLSLDMPQSRAIRFDYARHRRSMNFDRNYVRLNELPEWFVVDENALYRVHDGRGTGWERLGSELIKGVNLRPGRWIVERLRRPA